MNRHQETEIEKERIRNSIAVNISRLMTIDGYTTRDVQRQTGISHGTVAKLTRSEMMPSVFIIHKLANLFDVSIEWIINEHKY